MLSVFIDSIDSFLTDHMILSRRSPKNVAYEKVIPCPSCKNENGFVKVEFRKKP